MICLYCLSPCRHWRQTDKQKKTLVLFFLVVGVGTSFISSLRQKKRNKFAQLLTGRVFRMPSLPRKCRWWVFTKEVFPLLSFRVLLRMYDEDNPPFWRLLFAPPLIDSFGFHAAISMATHTPPKKKQKKGDSSRPTLPDVWLPTNFFCSNVLCVSFGFCRTPVILILPPFFFLCAHHFRSLALVIALTARAEWLRPCPRWIY